jgi:hypothetical protein
MGHMCNVTHAEDQTVSTLSTTVCNLSTNEGSEHVLSAVDALVSCCLAAFLCANLGYQGACS